MKQCNELHCIGLHQAGDEQSKSVHTITLITSDKPFK